MTPTPEQIAEWRRSAEAPTLTRLVEVHGNNSTGTTKAHAKRHVESDGLTVIDVRPSGERCRHGNIVWEVTALDPEADQ